MEILLFPRSGHPLVPHCPDLGGSTENANIFVCLSELIEELASVEIRKLTCKCQMMNLRLSSKI